jgi:hypothetical protein
MVAAIAQGSDHRSPNQIQGYVLVVKRIGGHVQESVHATWPEHYSHCRTELGDINDAEASMKSSIGRRSVLAIDPRVSVATPELFYM